MLLNKIKAKYGMIGIYTMMYIEIKCAQSQKKKIKANADDIEKYAKELAYDNMGTDLNELELIIYADKKRTQTLIPGIDTNVFVLRKVLNYAYQIGHLIRTQPKQNIYISVPVRDEAKDVRLNKEVVRKPPFVAPTVAECLEYFKSQGVIFPENHAKEFHDFHETRGWKIGKASIQMSSWKGAIRTWITRNYSGKIVVNKKGGNSSVYG